MTRSPIKQGTARSHSDGREMIRVCKQKLRIFVLSLFLRPARGL